jgi:hypothetical protein
VLEAERIITPGQVDFADVAAPTGATAWLADVVGSRAITVTVADDSDSSSGQDTFTFGDGLLSAFSKTGTGSIRGADKAEDIINIPANGFQDSANNFPAASVCGGTVNNNVTVTGSASTSYAGFAPAPDGWGPLNYLALPGDSYAVSYAASSKMATTMQLLPVARFDAGYNPGNAAGRKGAALAAGWPVASIAFMTGELRFTGAAFNVKVTILEIGATGDFNVATTGGFMYPGVPVCVP